jgi:hypothetical protein
LGHLVYLLFLKEFRLPLCLWLHHSFHLLYLLGEHFDLGYILQEIALQRHCLSILSQFGLMLRNLGLQAVLH